MDFDVADRQEEPTMLLRAGQRQTRGYFRGGARELESAWFGRPAEGQISQW